jgi:hypothetical protein
MRTNHQGQRRHPSASTGRRHDRARDVHNSFKATLDHGAPSRHDRYLREADLRHKTENFRFGSKPCQPVEF